MPVVTGIDLLGIQEYVFASNRLRDVLAASWMVDHVMRRERDSILQWGITDEHVLLAGGGNAIVEFNSIGDAKTWTTHYTRWLQKVAPGLEVVVAHRSYDDGWLAWGLKALAVDLARAKLERRPSAPQLGLSVTAACSVTGLPATSLDRHDGAPISRRVETLRQPGAQKSATERWNEYLPEELPHAKGWNTDFPLETDLMGRTHGETSLLGIVHVDGNGVGEAIKGWLDRCFDQETGDEQVRAEYREWSRGVEELGEHILHSLVGRVRSCVSEEENERGEKQCVVRGTPYDLRFALREASEDHSTRKILLPLRPILLGGDDLTFVCDGRIALDLAVTALREFEANPIPHLGQDGSAMSLTGSAGVAFVKAHAPFYRGYDLAESLCASAKHARLEANADTGCWLDWHIGSTRPSETIEEIRARGYDGGNLTMRPYPVKQFEGREQSWSWLDTELLGPGRSPEIAEHGFRGAKCWAGSRSRVKRLGSLVPEGRAVIQRQLEAWNAIEGGVMLPAGLSGGGFIGQRTPLLDAIELLDLHVRLEPDPNASVHGAGAPVGQGEAR